MDLRQALPLPVQAPAPPVAGFFDPTQEIHRDELVAVRITVGQPHNTFTMAEQFPKPTPIEGWVVQFSGMNLRQITRQGFRPLPILLPQPSTLGLSF